MGAIHTLRYATTPLWPRLVNVLLGVWLFASAFLWPHGDNVRLNDWMVGLLVASTALSAVWAPTVRWASTFLGAWLGFWALIFEYPDALTRVHDLALAAVVLALSFVSGGVPEEILEEPDGYTRTRA